MGQQTSRINEVEYVQAYHEVGQAGVWELALLRSWLTDAKDPPEDWQKIPWERITRQNPPWPEWRSRLAPSIICRSEAELFGVSTPRFALRVELAPRSFVNVRRIGTFCFQAERWLDAGKPSPRRWLRSLHPFEHPAWVLKDNRCVADSILQRPTRFDPCAWHILETPLGKAYGECLPGEADFPATPYVRHTSARGGLCAQASCFIATALMQAHARGVFGVAEVTALAFPNNTDFRLTGLEPAELLPYFSSEFVGLHAVWQQVRMGRLDTDRREFCRLLTSYLHSGCPVILPVDVGRMRGHAQSNGLQDEYDKSQSRPDTLTHQKSIFARNKLPDWFGCKTDPGHSYEHAIVVVGCQKQPPADLVDTLFVLHDPAHFPFMVASGAELFNAAIYNQQRTRVFGGLCLPVTPAPIKMPLGNRWQGQDPALIDLASAVQQGGFGTPFPVLADPGRFRLTTWDRQAVAKLLDAADLRLDAKVRDCLLSKPPPQNGKHWVMIQWTPNSVWVWDAQRPPPPTSETLRSQVLEFLLLAVWTNHRAPVDIYEEHYATLASEASNVQEGSGSLRSSDDATSQAAACPQQAAVCARPASLALSLISSFSYQGLQRALDHWPQAGLGQASSRPACELYAFMQEDAERFVFGLSARTLLRELVRGRFVPVIWLRNQCGRAGRRLLCPWKRDRSRPGVAMGTVQLSAIDRMARCQHSLVVLPWVAWRIARQFRARRIELVAVASFLPGLARGPETRIGRRSIRAMRYLIRLARWLRRWHPCLGTVEIVAGSRIVGVRREVSAETPGDYDYIAVRLGEDEAMSNLVRSLHMLAPAAQQAGLNLVLEYEPGPLHALGTPHLLESFAKRIQQADLTNVVGLNLDIAHWAFLSGLGPHNVPPTCLQAIRHAHVSSHGRGHFGDAMIEKGDTPDCLRRPEEFQPWIDFLMGRYPPLLNSSHSGYMSLELEVCRDLRMIQSSLENLRLLTENLPSPQGS